MNSGYFVLIVCDVEDWSSRPAVAQRHIQAALGVLMNRALDCIGIDGSTVPRALRGDGMILALPAATDKARVTTTFVSEVRELLFAYAPEADDDEQIRLRLVLHAGEISIGDGEFAGAAVVQACRMVDSDVARRVLAASRGATVVLAVSDEWYRATVGERYVLPGGFEQVMLQEKGFRGSVWIKVPGLSIVPGLSAGDLQAAEQESSGQSHGSRPGNSININGSTVNGNVVYGTNIAGDYVVGHKYDFGRISE